jgi:hypothetical protein
MTSTDTGEVPQTKPVANKSDGKASAKPGGEGDSKPKAQATTDKASGDKTARDTTAKGKSAKARAASQRTLGSKRAHPSPKHGALNVSKKKPATTTHPTAAASKGE